MNLRMRAGLALIAALLVLSVGYGLGSRLPGVPACPFGMDTEFLTETVCAETFGGLWRSIELGLFAGAASCGVAALLAFVGRLLGDTTDTVVEKIAEVFFSIPDLLILITIGFVAAAGGNTDGLPLGLMALALIAVGWAAPTRMMQNRLRTLERQDFARAAVAIGIPRRRILVRHLLPFAAEYLFAIFLLRVPAIVLTESTVSYLGFGLPHDQPSLGKFIGTRWPRLATEDWFKVVPAWFLLVALVVGFQWVGQGLLARSAERRK
jgi:peptide/nickel transport system permease protein